MCMFLFAIAGVAGILWTVRLLKPKLFLLDNEAALYPTHNPLNFNLTKLQAFMLASFALFSFVTSLVCLLVLSEAVDIKGKLS